NDLCGGATEDTLEVSYWDGSQWVTTITYTSTSGTPYDNAYFQEFLTVPFSDFSTDFKIRFSSTETINGDDWYIDELVVGPSPCSPPTAISIGSITDTTADVTWTPGGSETQWEIEYGPTGFLIGTGMILLDNNGTPGETLTDLAPETTYDVYVRALCTQFTSVAGPETFTTAILDCPSVTNITVEDVTETSFEVNWIAGGAETSWKIEYGPDGFTPGTGIVVIDNDGIGEVIIGLDPDTQYDVYVSAICDGFDGVAIGPVAFDTFMGIEDQVFEGFSFYPNPVSGQLYLKASSQVQEVVIYNLLGQKIMKITPNSLAPTLELSNLQTGTYLMQVTINGSTGVYKILKE
ncbi:MAG TPA: fibronectin type III domain-containing protein, partial [Flavobacteriaceae bacterium]|nr:fibronectin type III domain-containing protein [Flavobacteriaceae bacterium]